MISLVDRFRKVAEVLQYLWSTVWSGYGEDELSDCGQADHPAG